MITEDRGHHHTIAKITTATQQDCYEEIVKYFRNFLPAGYGTKVRIAPHRVPNPAKPGVVETATWQAEIVRDSSCGG